MQSKLRIDIVALVISIAAIAIALITLLLVRPWTAAAPRTALQDLQLRAISKSELASNRAQCFLRVSGKDTSALALLHLSLLERNKRILDSFPQQANLTTSELMSAAKAAIDTLNGAVQVERQVTLTKQSMSPSQLQAAIAVCPGEG
ncbi:hypothetical protein [Cognatiluteimonas telluris]|uniref:hypothetical protein n=1 Tax=Cognatiluteimonas telluris TaxID=1104775 RepID=UPI00140DC5B2|nr:hypothetical protein [Lysobacter telluris]